MIRVLLADDQALVRAGFQALLDAQEDIEVVGEANDGEEAVRLAWELVPDVVLMDIRMPGTDGLEATRRILHDQRLDHVRILILTTFDVDEYVFEALRVGASGFLVKDTDPGELVQGVRAVARGDALLSPGVTRRLISAFAERGGDQALPAGSDVGRVLATVMFSDIVSSTERAVEIGDRRWRGRVPRPVRWARPSDPLRHGHPAGTPRRGRRGPHRTALRRGRTAGRRRGRDRRSPRRPGGRDRLAG